MPRGITPPRASFSYITVQALLPLRDSGDETPEGAPSTPSERLTEILKGLVDEDGHPVVKSVRYDFATGV